MINYWTPVARHCSNSTTSPPQPTVISDRHVVTEILSVSKRFTQSTIYFADHGLNEEVAVRISVLPGLMGKAQNSRKPLCIACQHYITSKSVSLSWLWFVRLTNSSVVYCLWMIDLQNGSPRYPTLIKVFEDLISISDVMNWKHRWFNLK